MQISPCIVYDPNDHCFLSNNSVTDPLHKRDHLDILIRANDCITFQIENGISQTKRSFGHLPNYYLPCDLEDSGSFSRKGSPKLPQYHGIPGPQTVRSIPAAPRPLRMDFMAPRNGDKRSAAVDDQNGVSFRVEQPAIIE